MTSRGRHFAWTVAAGGATLSLIGALLPESTEALRDVLRMLVLVGPSSVSVDLGQVDQLSATALQEIVDTAEVADESGRNLTIRAPGDSPAAEVLRSLGEPFAAD